MARPHVADQLIEEVESLHVNNRGYPASSFQEALATVIEMAQPATLEEKRLTVSTAYPNDSGRNIARMHPDTMNQLSLQSGDIIQIRGEETTAATVWEVDGPDAGRGDVRIDGFTRENAGAEVGEHVEVRPVDADPARQVEFALAEGVTLQEDAAVAKYDIKGEEAVIDRAITLADTVPVTANESAPFNETSGRAVPLLVTELQPEGVVRITDDTEIKIRWDS